MTEKEQQNADKRLTIGKIYVKDISFESPQSPAVFSKGDWSPQTNLNLRSSANAVERMTSAEEVLSPNGA